MSKSSDFIALFLTMLSVIQSYTIFLSSGNIVNLFYFIFIIHRTDFLCFLNSLYLHECKFLLF
jgi:hypothetical protein